MRVNEQENIGICSEFLEGTLDKIVSRLKKHSGDKENVRFTTEWVQDGESYLILVWDRPETKKELNSRLGRAAKVKAEKKARARARKQQEIKTYERLKAKYG